MPAAADQVTPAHSLVRVEGLTKAYGDVIAAQDVGFELRSGEILGLLGPNGAGKTTTLECVEGLRTPDRGEVVVAGLDPVQDYRAARKVMGVQLQMSALPDTMTPSEAMSLMCGYHGLASRLDLLERFGLGSKLEEPYRALSTGQKRRLALALALAHDPPVLLLDEPTAGLDVASRTELHREMDRARKEGAAIVLATHDMAEAEKMCDRIAILLRGRIVAEGPPREITAAGASATKVTVRTEGGTFVTSPVELPHATLKSRADGYAEYVSTDAAATVSALLTRMTKVGDRLVDLRVERPTLEERFLEITESRETA